MALRPDISAAGRTLGILRSVDGLLGQLRVGSRSYTASISPNLRSKPKSRTNLKWVLDTGHYRELWLEDRGRNRRHLYHVYFGPWNRRQAKSAYIVVFRSTSPALEIRLSKEKPPPGDRVFIDHPMAFRGQTYGDTTAMRRAALRIVHRAGVPVADDRALIGAYRITPVEIVPSPRRFLQRVIVCAVAKTLIIERAAARRDGASERGRSRKAKRKEKKGLRWKKNQLMHVHLDERFHSHELHEKLIGELQERLRAQGIKAELEHPYDLVVARGRSRIVIEMKAWRRGGIAAAAQAAAGQLLYYAYSFRRGYRVTPKLLLALWKRPPSDDVRFLESSDIGVIWQSRRGWGGDSRARKLLPELIVG